MTHRDPSVDRNNDRFGDIYHHHEDDYDEDIDEIIDFDNMFKNIGHDNDDNDDATLHDKDESNLLAQLIGSKEQDKDKDVDEDDDYEQEHLSQKLSQLIPISHLNEDDDNDVNRNIENYARNLEPTTTMASSVVSKKRPVLTPSTSLVEFKKKIKTEPLSEGDEDEQQQQQQQHYEQLEYQSKRKEMTSFYSEIPKYLSSSSKIFDQMMMPHIKKTSGSLNIEYAREYAIITHRLECIKLDIRLWKVYLRSGTGKLKLIVLHKLDFDEDTYDKDIDNDVIIEDDDDDDKVDERMTRSGCILRKWPDEVKQNYVAAVQQSRSSHSQQQRLPFKDHEEFVHHQLKTFQQQLYSHQERLNELKPRLGRHFTSDLEKMIVRFVKKRGILLYRISIESQIVNVKHDYIDRYTDFLFDEQRPNRDQIDLYHNLIDRKIRKERAYVEVSVLKHRIEHNHLPKTFDKLVVPTPMIFAKLNNAHVRERLKDRSDKIFQRTKTDLMLVYLATAEAEMNESRIRFEQDLTEMRACQRSGPTNKQWTTSMVNILEDRLRSINQRLTVLYKLKLHFFDIAPTVKK